MAIQKRLGVHGSVSYRVRLRGRPDPVTGKQKWLTETFRTKKVAETFERKAQVELSQGTAVDPSKETVRDYFTRWLATIAQRRNRPKTIACYESPIRTRIFPALGNLRPQDLRPHHIQEFYSAQLASPKLGRHKGTLSPRMVRLMHSILHKALKDAERLGLVAFNPVAKVSPPSVPKPTVQTWQEAHYQAFLPHTRGDHYGEALWLTALATGMREGEILAVRWRNLDLERGTVAVCETLSYVGGKLDITDQPKTSGSRRTIKLDPDTIEALRAHRLRQLERRLERGDMWQDLDLVFPNESGNPIWPRNLTRHFDLLQGRAGVPRIRFHDLRHTSATIALESGVPIKVVSERLGHASTRITQDTYLHISPHMQNEAANLIGQALNRGRRTRM